MDSGTGIYTTHILLLEDDRSHQDLVLRAFRDDPGPFRVSIAGTLGRAREVMEGDPPDLIIADWILPDGKGLDILPRQDGLVTIPLVIMTSYGDEHLAVEIMKSGAIDYVVKSATMFRDLPHIARRALRDWENIKERKQAEEAVQEGQKRLADILAFLPDAVLAIDNEGRVIAWNNAIERMTGVAADNILGKGDHEHSIPFYGVRRPILIDLILMGDMDIEKKYDYLLRENGRITSETFIPTMYNGKGAYLWGTASPLFDNSGNRIGAIEVIRDITERKRSEDLLSRREAILATLLNAPHDSIALLDPKGTIIGINNEGAQQLGGTAGNITGMGAYDLFPEDVAAQRKTHIDRVFKTGEPAVFDETRSGISLHTEVFPVFSQDHTLVENIAIFARDITDQKKAELTLQESERNLARAQEIGHVGSWEWDPGNESLVWSEEMYRIFGVPRMFCLTFGNIVSHIHPDDRERNDRIVKELFAAGTGTEYEFRIVRPDGIERSVIQKIEVTRDGQGSPKKIFGIIQDITEQKEAETALIESEKKYRFLLENVRDIIWQTTPDLVLTYVSSAAELLTGYPVSDLIGTSLFNLLTESSAGIVRERLQDRFRDFSVGNRDLATVFEAKIRKKDGSLLWIEISSNAVLDHGTITGFQGISRDITERKKAEEKLRESEEKYHRLYDSMMDAFVSVEMDGRITLCNEPFQKIVGFEKEEIYTLTYNDLTPDKWHTMEADIVKNQVLTRGYSEVYEKEYRRKDGMVIPVELRTFLIRDDAGNPQGMSAMVRDISERKQAEDIRKAYESRLDSAMEIGNLAWWEMDLPDGAVRFDDRKVTIIGYSPARFHQYTDFMALLHPDDYDPAMQAMRDHLEGRDPRYHIDYRMHTAAGDYRWFRDVGGITKRHIDGSPATVTGIFIDITAEKQADEHLRESEEKFRTVADYTYDWEYWVGTDGRYRYVSPSCERITGYKPDAFYEDPKLVEKIVHPDDVKVFQMHADSLQETTGIKDITEFRIITRDGRIVWIGHLCRPIISNDGKYLGRRGSNRDITERKLAEAALRENETRFRMLIQNSSDIIRILDREGRIIYESPSAERILGYPSGSLTGKNPLAYIHPDDLERVKREFLEVLDHTNSGIPTEFRIRKADGEYLWVDSIGTNLLDVRGVNGIVVTTRPIQQRKEAEKALSESEERLRLAIEGGEMASWDWDLVSGNAVFSDKFYTMLGYTPGEFMASYEGWTALMHPDERDQVLADLRHQIQEKSPLCEIEYRLISKDGHWIWVLSRGKITNTDENGNPTRITGINIDVTDRRLMESEIRSLNTVLEQRVRDRTEALAKTNESLKEEGAQRQVADKKLKASYDEKVMLLKEIHHRVKNNLQIIVSLLNLQSRYITDTKTLAAIRESQNRVKAMALVHEKLYQSEDISRVSLHDYIRFLGNGLFQFYDAKIREIQFILEIHDVNVDIDSAIPLGLILNELISNSLKYAFPEGRKGEIAVKIKKEGHTITVLYRDTGIGIPEDLDWRDTKSLGLRLVTALVDQMNGTVELDRTSGTTFKMVLQEKEQQGLS